MATTKPAKEKQSPLLYDSQVSQVIPFTLTRGGKDYQLTHTLKPLSNERYFKFQSEIEAMAEKVKSISTKIYQPKQTLWLDLIESQTGYKERPDWIEKMPQTDAVLAVNAILHAQVLDESEVDVKDGADLYDIDALTPITFRALFAGRLLELTHQYRPMSQDEINQFLAIESNEPVPNVLASAVKLSKAENLYELGKTLLQERDGYADGSEIPAWHLATTTESYFLRHLGRMGKFLAA